MRPISRVLAAMASHAGCWPARSRVTSAVSTAGGPNSPPWARPRGRFRLGDPRLFADGQTTRQPMGCRSYDDFGRWAAGARSRHVRACLSHGFRCQGRLLCRRLYGSDPLGQWGEAVRALQQRDLIFEARRGPSTHYRRRTTIPPPECVAPTQHFCNERDPSPCKSISDVSVMSCRTGTA
jgi:hypothetical protein